MRLLRVFILFILSWPALLFAELNIEITQGVQDPTPIAVVPFAGQNISASVNVTKIIEDDLQRSGLFRTIARSDMLSLPSSEDQIYYRDWRVLGASYLAIGNVMNDTESQNAGNYIVEYSLYDILAQKRVFRKTISASSNGARDAAHLVSDDIYEAITGIRGVFSTCLESIRRCPCATPRC